MHILFIGADAFPIYRRFAASLKWAGARVSSLGPTPPAALDPDVRRWLDDHRRVQSLFDPREMLAEARQIDRLSPIDRVETADESLVMAAAKLRESLGLPGLSVRSAMLCRDKTEMKEVLRRGGVSCAESMATESPSQVRAFVERHGFPVILKPRSGLGSEGTYRCESVADLDKAVRALGVDRGQSVAIEEFVEGHEGFYDTLMVEGKPAHDFVSHYFPNVLEAMRNRRVSPQIAHTNRDMADGYQELRGMGRTVVQLLGIESGATHMEWFFGPKGLKFSEIGARPPGERIWDLYCAGNEIDLYKEWAAVAVHGKVFEKPSRRYATGSVQVRPTAEGRILGYDGLDKVLQRCGRWIFAKELRPPGSMTKPMRLGYLENAWFRLRHHDYDELLRMMDFIGRTLVVHTRPS